MKSQRLPLYQAVFFIFVSIFLISGSTHLLLKAYFSSKLVKAKRSDFYITHIVQTGPNRDMLTTNFLAEILNLSQDQPTSIFRFDPSLAEKKLQLCPMIKKAKVAVIHPNTVFIDYELRRPMAFLYDYENTAIDEEGYIFPFYPFYTPKKLPEIYLGLDKKYSQINQNNFYLAHEIIAALEPLRIEKNLFLKRLDVSQAFNESLGKREVVALINSEDNFLKTQRKTSHYLRLSSKNYLQELGNYLVLYDDLRESGLNSLEDSSHCIKLIDLRMDGIALIKEF